MKTVVDGLQLLPKSGNAKYIRCDVCRATFDATPVTSDSQELIRQAREAGWTGPMTRDSTEDRCPACAKRD